jgi:hypothetical protein
MPYNSGARISTSAIAARAIAGGKVLDGTRFDAWTRRRFGMATGGALAGLLGLSQLDSEAAKRHGNHNNNHKNKHKHKNKNKKKKCRKLGQSCDTSVKKKKCCNSSQLCSTIKGQGSQTFCCKQITQSCQNTVDCCGDNTCDSNGKCKAP